MHKVVYRYTDTHGCINADSANAYVNNSRSCEIVIWVPDAFSPDGNGVNDVFRPSSLNIYSFSMYIYNRLGQLLFTSSRISDGWDGTFGGQPCPAGRF